MLRDRLRIEPRPAAAEAALVELEMATAAALDGRWAKAARLAQRAESYLDQLAAAKRREGRRS